MFSFIIVAVVWSSYNYCMFSVNQQLIMNHWNQPFLNLLYNHSLYSALVLQNPDGCRSGNHASSVYLVLRNSALIRGSNSLLRLCCRYSTRSSNSSNRPRKIPPSVPPRMNIVEPGSMSERGTQRSIINRVTRKSSQVQRGTTSNLMLIVEILLKLNQLCETSFMKQSKYRQSTAC